MTDTTDTSAGTEAPQTPAVQAPAAGTTEIERVRREAAGYRVERNELKTELDAMRVKILEAESRTAQAVALSETAKSRVLETTLAATLVAAGIRDPEQHAILLPGLAARAAAAGVAVGDDLKIAGDLSAIVAGVAAKFATPPQQPASTTQGFARQLTSNQTPLPAQPLSGRAALAARLRAAREQGK